MPTTCSSLSPTSVQFASTAGSALGASPSCSSSSLLSSAARCLKARRHAKRFLSFISSHMRLTPAWVLMTLQTKERSPTCRWRVVMAGVCLPAFSLNSSPLSSAASSASREFACLSRLRRGAPLAAFLLPALRWVLAGTSMPSASSRPERWLLLPGAGASGAARLAGRVRDGLKSSSESAISCSHPLAPVRHYRQGCASQVVNGSCKLACKRHGSSGVATLHPNSKTCVVFEFVFQPCGAFFRLSARRWEATAPRATAGRRSRPRAAPRPRRTTCLARRKAQTATCWSK